MPDAFDTLGLSPRFDHHPAVVRRSYLARSAAIHAQPGSDESQFAAVNQARDDLINPERRAEVLLRRLGGSSKEQDRSLPDGFLADILETREAIEAATSDLDRARWKAWALEQRQQFIARVGGLFAHAAAVPASDQPGVLALIRRELNAWRYIERLLEQLDGRPID